MLKVVSAGPDIAPATVATSIEIHSAAPPVRKNTIDADPSASVVRDATTRLPRDSASLPPATIASKAGTPCVMARSTKIPAPEYPRTSDRYRFVNCKLGEPKKPSRNPIAAAITNRPP